MSLDDSNDDPIEDLREHQSTIKSINVALMSLKDIDAPDKLDTREIEHRLHEIIGDEIYKTHEAIDLIETAEDHPESS